MPERLQRSTTNRVWAGVCGGIAEYFQVDPTLVRAFFVIATIFSGGLFFLVYIALIILMPLPGRPGPLDGTTAGSTPAAPADPNAPTQAIEAPRAYQPSPEASRRRREAAGLILVALGVVFLLSNAGAFRFVEFRFIWPLALIALGVFIVLQRSRP